jgi:hypothetical protein
MKRHLIQMIEPPNHMTERLKQLTLFDSWTQCLIVRLIVLKTAAVDRRGVLSCRRPADQFSDVRIEFWSKESIFVRVVLFLVSCDFVDRVFALGQRTIHEITRKRRKTDTRSRLHGAGSSACYSDPPATARWY